MTADHLFQQAKTAFAAGNITLSKRLARETLALHPEHAEAHSLLGLVFVQAENSEEALPHWKRAAELRPDVPTHRYNLGELLRRLGDFQTAEVELRTAVQLAPSWAEAVFGLGNVLKDRGQTPEALSAFRKAIELNPRCARALFNRGNLLREQGQVSEAERDYRAALAIEPTMIDAVVNLAAALGELHRWAEAEGCYRQALAKRPDNADLHAGLAGSVLAQGRTSEAAELMAGAEPFASEPTIARFRRQTLLPPIPNSHAATLADRERLVRVLEEARRNPPPVELVRLHQGGLEPSLMLAYQAEDVRPLLEAYAAIYTPQIEPLKALPRSGEQPRVGVVVTHGHEGVYDRCLGRLVERIAAGKRVQITVVCSVGGANVLRHLRPTFPGEYLTIANRVDEAAARIHEAQFDVLHYWEVGTDATNYFLPFFRPARVQCATWGWPVTSGNPRMDRYVSSALLEPEEGQRHYTERLVRLPSLPTCYERPPAPIAPASPALRRKAFGVDAATPVYLCVQNLRKVQPDFDELLAALLQHDRRGRVVFLADEQPGITESLLKRLRGSLGGESRRVGVVARQNRNDYLRLVSSADVLLDTLHYGGGANTVADAIACGTPMVTLAGHFHRGRWATAVLQQAGLGELVANSITNYAGIAKRLANDGPHRIEVSRRLQEFGEEWFDNPQPAEELEAFWLQQVAGV